MAIIRQAEERKVPVWRITMLQVSAIAGFLLLAGTFWFFQVIQHEQEELKFDTYEQSHDDDDR